MPTTQELTPEQQKWAIIYPIYIDAKKTRAEGRRIGTSKACENPTINEIVTVCNALKIEAIAEVCHTLIIKRRVNQTK